MPELSEFAAAAVIVAAGALAQGFLGFGFVLERARLEAEMDQGDLE